MSNSIAPGSSADVNVRVTALTTNPNVPAQYKTIILKKNLVNGVNTLTQAIMNQTNTKYVIKYDYVLGEDITIPANCILEFDGGSISASGSNDTITGNNTGIIASETLKLFTSISFGGTWLVKNIYATWFTDIQQTNRLKQVFNLSSDNIKNNIIIPSTLTCSVAASSGEEHTGVLQIKSNTTILLDGTISLEPNSLWGYVIVSAVGKNNILIKGKGSIIGDKDGHTMNQDPDHLTNEWGYGLFLNYSTNVTIEGISISKCTGDGICFSNTIPDSSTTYDIINNYTFKNINISYCRRQGISVLASDTILIEGVVINNIEGTNPQSCIDIEPGYVGARNITIRNCTLNSTNNSTLLILGSAQWDANLKIKNIIIENIRCNKGIRIYGNVVEDVWIQNTVFDGLTSIGVSDGVKNVYIQNCVLVTSYFGSSGSKIDDTCANICFDNCLLSCSICPNNTTMNNCILIKCHFNEDGVYKNLTIKNSKIVDTHFSLGSAIENIILENNVVYQIYETTYNSMMTAGANNIQIINNTFIAKFFPLDLRNGTTNILICGNRIFSNIPAGFAFYIDYTTALVLNNIYNQQIAPDDTGLSTSNIKNTIIDVSYTLPTDLQILYNKYVS